MGLFSGIKNWVNTNVNSAINDVTNVVNSGIGGVKDVVGNVIGDMLGGGSAPASQPPTVVSLNNNAKARQVVIQAYMKANNLTGVDMVKAYQYLVTPAGKSAVAMVEGQLNAGANAQGAGITNYLNQLFGAVVAGAAAGVQTGVQNAVTNGINTTAQNLGASSGAQSLQETVGQFFSGAGSAALKDWFKKNWFWVLFPVVGLCVFFYARTSSGQKNTRKVVKAVKRNVPQIRKAKK